MTNRRKAIIVGVVIVAILAMVAIGATRIIGPKKEDKEDKMEVVRRGEFVVKVRETGNLESRVAVDVRSNVEGEIEKIFVKEGDLVEKGQELIKINDRQIKEQKKQAEANRDARKAQLEQARLRIYLTEKQQTSEITQAQNTVKGAAASLDSLKATTLQRVTEAETQISTTENLLEQDQIASRQADISLQQAQLTLQQYQSAEKSAKVAADTADSELKRNQDLFEQKLVSKKTLEDAETRRASAISQYEAAKKNVESQLQAVEFQKQNIEARKRAIESRQTTLQLQEQNLVALKEAQEAQRKQLQAELESAKTRLQQILDTTKQEKELTVHSEVSAQAALLEAASNLDAQEERLGWTTVIAPITGTVTRLDVEEGEIITSGRSAFSRGPALMTIANLSKMVVKTQINEVDIAKVKVGQPVEIRVDTYPDQVFKGQVTELSPSAIIPQPGEDRVITFEVTIEVLGSPSELLPGMSADVDIIVFKQDDILQLPIEAVMNPEVLTVKANVPAEDLKRLHPDQAVEVQNLIGKKFAGKVGAIRTDRTRGNVEILLDGTPLGLRTGPTEISILLSETNRIAGVEAEIESEKKYFVLLDKGDSQDADKKKKKGGKKDKKDEKGVKTRIEVGQRSDSHFEILSGVQEGDRVFVPSMQQLTQQDQNKK